MHNFKVGDVVLRTEVVPLSVSNMTGVYRGEHYTVSLVGADGDICLRESTKQGFPFDPTKFELALAGSPADDPWSQQQALRLRKSAEYAITMYNEYIQKQPRLKPINIK